MNTTVAALLMDVVAENSTLYENGTIEKFLETLNVMPDPQVKLAHDILICVLLVSVMFAMGCHITWSEVSEKNILLSFLFLFPRFTYATRKV